MKKSKKSLLNFGSRTFILTAAIIVILGGVVSGTVAWMYIKSQPVSNTFTYGDMKIELEETDTGLDGDEDDDTNSYSFEPGSAIVKDPWVTIKAETENCWLLVKAEASDNFDEFMEYSMEEGWKPVDEETYPGVYYREVTSSKDEQKFNVIKDNVVTVKDGVTQQTLDELEEEDYPSLKFTAYAVQKSEVKTAKEAWKAASGK